MRQNGGWVRLYCDVLENPKLRRLSESSQLFFFWCLLLHKRGHLAGKTETDIAYCLRLKVGTVKKRLQDLREANLILTDNTPKGWDECQYASDSGAERVRAFRERQAQQKRNAGVTACVTAVTSDAKRFSNGAEQNRTEREEQSTRAREGDSGTGEQDGKDARQECPPTPVACDLGSGVASPASVTGSAADAVKGLVEKCRVELRRVQECGEEWQRLDVGHLVDLARQHPKAVVSRVVDRVRSDFRGQAMPTGKNPAMLVRERFEWDEEDALGIKKKAADRVDVSDPAEYRRKRLTGELSGGLK